MWMRSSGVSKLKTSHVYSAWGTHRKQYPPVDTAPVSRKTLPLSCIRVVGIIIDLEERITRNKKKTSHGCKVDAVSGTGTAKEYRQQDARLEPSIRKQTKPLRCNGHFQALRRGHRELTTIQRSGWAPDALNRKICELAKRSFSVTIASGMW